MRPQNGQSVTVNLPPMLQGISQQAEDQRQPGQVSWLENMLCDPVTGLRRRPGLRFVRSEIRASSTRGFNTRYLYCEPLDIAGARVHVWVDTHEGSLMIRNSTTLAVVARWDDPYLKGEAKDIQTVVVQNKLYVLNRKQRPAPVRSGNASSTSGGWFYIASGAFNQTYTIEVANHSRGRVLTVHTPTAETAGAASESTPSRIAERIMEEYNKDPLAGVSAGRQGGYVYFMNHDRANPFEIRSSMGENLLVSSGSGRVRSTALLPQSLPRGADGLITAVGTGGSPAFYRWSEARMAWLETAEGGHITGVRNAPRSIWYQNGVWYMSSENQEWPGAQAGDTTSNPTHTWITDGITGMSAYQGRLVLMSGNMVSMSSSKNPQNFFRTTVTEVIDSDPIEIGSAAQNAAYYTHAVPFQRDLVLFSDSHQAVIPAHTTAITPRTATLIPSSSVSMTSDVKPLILERSLLFARPTTSVGPFTQHSGISELIPSPTTDNQYVPVDATPHLPRFLEGQVVAMSNSPSVPVVAIKTDSGLNRIFIHEYTWSGEARVQSAWHVWSFLDGCGENGSNPFIEAVYFDGPDLYVIFTGRNTKTQGQHVFVIGKISPRGGGGGSGAYGLHPLLDLFSDPMSLTGSSLAWNDALQALFPGLTSPGKAALSLATPGQLWGDTVPLTPSLAGNLVPPTSVAGESAYLGSPYASFVVPTVPVLRDEGDQPVHGNRSVLMKYTVTTTRSQDIQVDLYKGSWGTSTLSGHQSWHTFSQPYKTMHIGTRDFDPGPLALDGTSWQAQSLRAFRVMQPLRNHWVKISAEGSHEMNLLGMSAEIRP